MVRTTGLALVMIGVAGPMVSTVDAQTEGGEAVAIVVHPEVAIDDDNLTLDQLRSIFLAERQLGGSLPDHAPREGRDRARARPDFDRDLWDERGPLPTVLDRQDVS